METHGPGPEHFMREAIRVSFENVRKERGGPFGSIVVRGNEIVGRGWNQVTTANDPTAHAEVMAIRDACARLGTFRLDSCTLYASCEPCPMCLSAIYWARIEHVYFAATRTDAARAGFDDDWIYRELARPAEQRQIPGTPCLRDEALGAFEEWGASTRKQPY